ncbi:MAG: hypothetical protein D8M59_08650 [Planctomycetes bacterium]|nr:hypothetical protein [Planctomycetota bacterium]NOG53932.1 hypothetical protein [Planctomycetota bacterium]
MLSQFATLATRAVALTLCICLPLCTGCASYVNIPADGRDTALNAVNLPPVPDVMGRALAFSINSYPAAAAGGPTAEGSEGGTVALFRYYLPDGASSKTYSRVGSTLNALGLDTTVGGEAHFTSFTEVPHYVVTAVRIRGDNAQVDVVLPAKYAPRNLLQIGMQGGLSAWRVMSYSRYIPTQDDSQRAVAYSTPHSITTPELEPAGDSEPTTMPEQAEESTEPMPQTQPDTTSEEPLRPVTIPSDQQPSSQPDAPPGNAIEEVTKKNS